MSDRTFDGIDTAASLRSDPVLRRAVLSCTIGQVFENYDFVLYGFMAAALSRAFFPADDQIAALLGTFATFGVGFLMRPVGAFVIGRFGDKYGRRQALVLTIVMMALATGIIGLIPTYAAIGVFAPALLVLCRLFQGFAAGGEWGGAAVFLVEYAPQNKRGYISSYQQLGTGLGLLVATFFAALLTYFLDASTFQSWGWRIPFLIGFILGPIGHYLRTHVAETPAFIRHVQARNVSDRPIQEAFATQRRGLIVVFGISIISVCLYWVFLVFLPTFAARQLHIDASSTFFSTTFSGLIYVLLTPVVGALSDRIGRKPPLYAAAVASIVLPYPLFGLLVSWHSFGGLVLTQGIATVVLTFCTGVACAVLAEEFPTRVRYTALSVSYGLSVAIFGGFAPFIGTALISATGNPTAPAYYVMFGGVLGLIAVFFVREGARRPLLD
ncbi:MAG: MFS transporter [Rhodospirillales bacterium]|nr:MFS transporter [Acetobacter sp.]